jgi:hypothetical protein
MDPFRRRPLAALFLMATLCVDALVPALQPAVQQSGVEYLLLGALVGQAWTAGAWLVLGSAHRLSRGAVFVAAMTGLATLLVLGEPHPNASRMEWGRAFGVVSLMGVAAVVGAAIAAAMLRATAPRPAKDRPLQFPIVEFFGWTIVVAFGSWAVSTAQYGQLVRVEQSLIYAMSSSAVAGIAAALATRGSGRATVRVVLPAAVVVAFLASYAIQGGIREPALYYAVHWAFAYLGAALAVSRLEAASLDQAGDEPAVIRLPR